MWKSNCWRVPLTNFVCFIFPSELSSASTKSLALSSQLHNNKTTSTAKGEPKSTPRRHQRQSSENHLPPLSNPCLKLQNNCPDPESFLQTRVLNPKYKVALKNWISQNPIWKSIAKYCGCNLNLLYFNSFKVKN